ncbi:TCEA1 [Bugula neritina]|uniref:Transcription elongation factor n=1 Tax=Bugula neritina TaxID=10212 RepID=A0A7J7J3H5_BUGNE|nr:TCEA1 [Bugula neritina]
MATEDEVLKLGRKLEKASKSSSVNGMDVLKALEASKITLEVLTKTKIGMIVNNFRKSSNSTPESVALSKQLIKNWKKLLPSDTNKASGDSKKTPEVPSEPSEAQPVKAVPQLQRTPSMVTGDPVRTKCREMIETSLRGDGDLPDGSGSPEILAASIEEEIYKEFKNTDNKYKNKVRSRVANLRDKKNPALRENVLLCSISPERLVKMTPEEMASDEMKKIRQKFNKEAINDAQLAVSGGTATDLLKCGKCGKRNCTYNQVQTRSADEPMTTFCFCNECGHRWKFC